MPERQDLFALAKANNAIANIALRIANVAIVLITGLIGVKRFIPAPDQEY